VKPAAPLNFTRRSEWDFSWLETFPAEVSLGCIYEHARYALISIDRSFLFPKRIRGAAMPYLLPACHILGPAFFLGCFCPTNFPQMPYRDARERWKFDPAMLWALGLGTRWTFDPKLLVELIEDYSDPLVPIERKLELCVPINASRKQLESLLAQARNELAPALRPKRGAGARIRQDKTALKHLGATKLLEVLTAPAAIKHTEEVLGRPLFHTEAEWSRAGTRVRKNLEPYRAEAALLHQALSEKRKLVHFSYLNGNPEAVWA